jgi:hypothetical protein
MLFLCGETNGRELMAIKFVYTVSYLQVKCKTVCRCVEVNVKKKYEKNTRYHMAKTTYVTL